MARFRLIMATAAIGTLAAGSALSATALAGSASGRSTHAVADPLVTVCLTVTPKSVTVSVNGQTLGSPSAGLSRTCVATPF